MKAPKHYPEIPPKFQIGDLIETRSDIDFSTSYSSEYSLGLIVNIENLNESFSCYYVVNWFQGCPYKDSDGYRRHYCWHIDADHELSK